MKVWVIMQCALAASILPTGAIDAIEQETHGIGSLVGAEGFQTPPPKGLSLPVTPESQNFKKLKMDEESRWILLPEKAKSRSIAKLTWLDLTDYQRFWYMKVKIGIDPSWNRDRLNVEIRTNLPNLRTKLRFSPKQWIFSREGIRFTGQYEDLEWISILPADKRTVDEAKMFSFFTRENLDEKFMPFESYNEAARVDIIRAALIQHSTRPKDDALSRKIMEVTNWSELPSDLRFISFKEMFPLPMADLSLPEFKKMIKNDLPAVRRFVQAELDVLTAQEAIYPEQLFWIEQLAPSQRTETEQSFYDAYGHGFFDFYKAFESRTFVQLSEYDKMQSFQTTSILPLSKNEITWIQNRPADMISPLLHMRILRCMPWTDLSDDMRYMSFRSIVGIQDNVPIAQFEDELKRDFSALKARLQPRLDKQYARDGESPQQLYWIERIPARMRTTFERGMLNAYGYGYFDRETILTGAKFAPRRWEDRTFANQAFRIYQNIDKDPAHLEAFKKVISDGLGEEQVPAAVAAIKDIQGWIITFVNRSPVQLSAKQKSWALWYFSTLKNPLGIQAFDDLTIRIARDSGGK